MANTTRTRNIEKALEARYEADAIAESMNDIELHDFIAACHRDNNYSPAFDAAVRELQNRV